jgi:hypothetical protein
VSSTRLSRQNLHLIFLKMSASNHTSGPNSQRVEQPGSVEGTPAGQPPSLSTPSGSHAGEQPRLPSGTQAQSVDLLGVGSWVSDVQDVDQPGKME